MTLSSELVPNEGSHHRWDQTKPPDMNHKAKKKENRKRKEK